MAAIRKEKIARIRFMSLVINPYAVGISNLKSCNLDNLKLTTFLAITEHPSSSKLLFNPNYSRA